MALQSGLLVGVLVIQIVEAIALVLLWRAMTEARSAPAQPSLTALAEQIEPPLRKLFGQLEAEREQLRALLTQAQTLTHRLQTAPAPMPKPAAAPESDSPELSSREEARRLLELGHGAAEVAAATGLPEGEVRILANLASVRKNPGE